MRYVTVLLGVLFFSPFTLAGPGFYYPQTKGLPKGVQDAAHSVFRVVVFVGSAGVLPKKSYAEYERAFTERDLPALAKFGIGSYSLAPLYLGVHESNRHLDSYPIPNFSLSAGFFVEVPGEKELRFVMPKHAFPSEGALPEGFNRATASKDATAALKDWSPQFMVVDRMGSTIFAYIEGVVGDKDSGLRVLFHGHPSLARELPNLAKLDVESATNLVDLMVFIIPGIDRTGVRPLQLAAKAALAEEEVYSVGYPMPTQGRAKFKTPDSDGASLRVSAGYIRKEATEGYRNFLSKTLPSDAAVKSYLSQLVFHDADTVGGCSGAPLLNKAGEIVGITSRSRHDPKMTPEAAYTLREAYGPGHEQLRRILHGE